MSLTIGDLQSALTDVTEGKAAWGADMHPSKAVLLRTPDGETFQLDRVSASFVEGRFVLVLDGKP